MRLIYFSDGGVPLASSRGTSNGPDDVDVRYVLQAFEEMNHCQLTIHMRLDGKYPSIALLVEVNAWERQENVLEAQHLGSCKTTIGYKDRRTMGAAILQAMYQLDEHLAREELAKVKEK